MNDKLSFMFSLRCNNKNLTVNFVKYCKKNLVIELNDAKINEKTV